MLRFCKLLKSFYEMNISQKDMLALRQRLETSSCRAEDYESLIQIMRAHLAFTTTAGSRRPGQAGPAPAPAPPHPRQAAKGARRGARP
jgi:hypothetical protein